MGQNATRPIPLSELSAGELRRRALEYRGMARSATTAVVYAGLLRLAERFEGRADTRELADMREAELPDT
jgi:hypothetical protein